MELNPMEKIHKLHGGIPMQFEIKDINNIQENSYNPNELNESQYKHLFKEIKRTGCLQPIIINKEGIIIDGAHRYRACKEAGIKQIPCIIIETSKEEAMIQTINLNQIKGSFNPIKYAELLVAMEQTIKIPELLERINMSQQEFEQYLLITKLPEDNTPITLMKEATVTYTFQVPSNKEGIITETLQNTGLEHNEAFINIMEEHARKKNS